MAFERFETRHIGPSEGDTQEMLNTIGVKSIDELVYETIPDNIKLKKELDLEVAMSEFEYDKHIEELAAQNQSFKSYIGLGYYGTITPAPIRRNVLENPGWYTAYTPYQAEIAQGRLEALLNFQTMVMDFTGMEMANASLLDESTAGAEAMLMFFHSRSRKQIKAGVNKFFVSDLVYPQTKDVLIGRAEPLEIEIEFGNHETFSADESYFGAIVQYPASNGEVYNYKSFTENCQAAGLRVSVAADIMSLALLEAPGVWGVDCVFGSTQRFGVPMGYGGPHAAYFATKEAYKRNLPGRIIGASIDKQGKPGFRMALQTREQHIRRDKATSNICTAQALLAVMASFYTVYHGASGIKNIATRIHSNTKRLANALSKGGLKVTTEEYFDTITLATDDATLNSIRQVAEAHKVNFFYTKDGLSISLDETVTEGELETLTSIFAEASKASIQLEASAENEIIRTARTTEYLTHPVFNSYRSESDLMRYIKKLENRDLSLMHSMISLGSCTMKLNAATELYPISNPAFANVHPFVPKTQVQGYQVMLDQLGKDLSEITGFADMSFQPNSGAQGEYTGLMVIRAYHRSRGDEQRNICLIPSSAHGTNPASAVMAGMKVIVVACDEQGNIDVADLKAKAEEHSNELSALMVTYPSTHGVFEASITEIMDIIHENGGQVYMDGANMNAQVGLTSPGFIGADVCHLNLHKTFAIPHGGGGPGMGPIGVVKHLVPFLPKHPVIETGGEHGIAAISGAPFGSALILLISYGYIKLLGTKGVTNATKYAILNANYLKSKLESAYPVLYKGNAGRIAHEMILDCRMFKKEKGIEVEDIAKRLIDYGFHAPTVSFPVAGTLMIEPTESESKDELDRFAEAMIAIRGEVEAVLNDEMDATNNPLKNAPHTAEVVTADEWKFPYNRSKAAYPLPYLKDAKFWPFVGRVDNAYGDRNLVCSCLPMEAYES